MRLDLAISCGNGLLGMHSEQAFCVVDNMLLFRGTLNMREFATQLRIGSTTWTGEGRIHRGFRDLYAELRPDLQNVLQRPSIASIGGHSLGGVFAVLAADDMRRIGLAPPNVFTFGAPRIGNAAFCRSVDDSKIYRVHNPNDPITRLPPLCRHVGRSVRVTFPGGGLRGHSLERYVKTLELYGRETLENPTLES